MEQTIMAIVNKLDPSSLILVLFGIGVWKLATMAMSKFGEHADKMAESLESIAEDTSTLRVDIAKIVGRIDGHEHRINKLEGDK